MGPLGKIPRPASVTNVSNHQRLVYTLYCTDVHAIKTLFVTASATDKWQKLTTDSVLTCDVKTKVVKTTKLRVWGRLRDVQLFWGDTNLFKIQRRVGRG